MKPRKVLWAPWRMEFILSAHKKKSRSCVFCILPRKGVSASGLIVHKGKKAFIILNRYPYTNGHLMVVPLRHLDLFENLQKEEHIEMGWLISRAMGALKKEFGAQGFNVGLNLGKASGAGIKDHLHYHVVPRWTGDSNFMPVLGEVRTMPEHILETYRKLKKYF